MGGGGGGEHRVKKICNNEGKDLCRMKFSMTVSCIPAIRYVPNISRYDTPDIY